MILAAVDYWSAPRGVEQRVGKPRQTDMRNLSPLPRHDIEIPQEGNSYPTLVIGMKNNLFGLDQQLGR